MGGWNGSGLCFIVDVSVAWLASPLERRGFLVFKPYRDYRVDAGDHELCEWSSRTGCVVVSRDPYFANMGCGVWVPHRMCGSRNSWEIVTWVVKRAALLVRSIGGAGDEVPWRPVG